MIIKSGYDSASAPPDSRRWLTLAVLSLMQFTFILDLTVVNVALPQIRTDLGLQPSGLAWVVNGYALMAGGLLLLGGRLADLVGRRRIFLSGVVVFALASLLSGVAREPGMLLIGRFAQGAGEALAAPAGLAIVVVSFTDVAERAKAIGIYAGLSAVGGNVGVVLSGVINEITTWRWIFYINLPIALVALSMVPRLVRSDTTSSRGRLDPLGGLTLTAGMVALVYGLLQAAERPWTSAHVLGALTLGLVLLVVFAIVERTISVPLVPLAFFVNRTRMTASVTLLILAGALFSMFFVLSLYMQSVLRWSPLENGLAYLPYGLLIVCGVGISMWMLPRLGARPLLAVGCVMAGTGMFLLSGIPVDGHYLSDIMPGSLVLGVGTGLMFPPLGNACMHGVSERNAGLASAVQGAVYQIGGALGLAVLVTLALRHEAAGIRDGALRATAATEGYAYALRIGAVLMLAATLLVALLLRKDEKPVGTDAGNEAGTDAGNEAEQPQPGSRPW
jgi:EmrB/QacA subfamily drug resistance transporter